MAFDKTGTLTRGQPVVTEVRAADNAAAGGPTEEAAGTEALRLAAALEHASEHPLGEAVVREAAGPRHRASGRQRLRGRDGPGRARPRRGQERAGGERPIHGGVGVELGTLAGAARELEARAHTVVFVAAGGSDERPAGALGLLAIADQIKETSAAAVAELRGWGCEPIMLTGDNERTAAAVAEAVGITRFHAGLLPEEKVEAIRGAPGRGTHGGHGGGRDQRRAFA